MLEPSEVRERLLQLTNERGIILSKIAKTASQKLKGQPILNQKIDDRKTLLKTAKLFPFNPSCQEAITLELIETNWGDDKPKEEVIIVTSNVFTPSTGQMEEVYDFSLNPLLKNNVGGVRGSHNTQRFTNETFEAIHKHPELSD
ncbi:hypothetical protein CO165_00615 [Candidatus Roizmanbacteria bacterium CG_4_9_14_3_um_filter_33_18]|uniref:Uncharacterized protein n=1 Tax=Candidatus Roizmanbacteria bacterium CG_4_9_14_3_um_filter_33_18 TaxID=1974841 RepID=A0A2M7XZ58_9BACT|nr:MAG: hypothetical protein CO165_00615 [Candidatus Roizmanbacteria bacterium CG_4_9_14_3_um_filter_33_18]